MPPSYNAFIKTSPRSLRNVGRDVRSQAAVVPMSPMVFAVSMRSGARGSGPDSRDPSSGPLTKAGLAEIPTTSACRASLIAVRTPLSPSPAMKTRLPEKM